MFHFHHKDGIGRQVPKPENKRETDDLELLEEAVPIQQQIENLRTKITLQERYNAALKDSMEEASQSTHTIIRDMFAQVYNLRLALKEAVSREKWAVNNSLRTHRLFQLCLKKALPNRAMSWMDDMLFDNTKLLNEHIDRLAAKRRRLETSEVAVSELEKWPVPGSQPWEIKLNDKIKQIGVAQTNCQLKLECAKVLYSKYVAIREKLRHDEQFLYSPIIRNLSSQLSFQMQELKNLAQMLVDAQKFQKDAEETLVWTEKEASANRKWRRAQIAKMRREMQRIIQEEQESFRGKPKRRSSANVDPNKDPSKAATDTDNKKTSIYKYESLLFADEVETQQNERLAMKRTEIESFNDNAALLVDIMKIPNLTHIPSRLESVLQLHKNLKLEKVSKENLKNVLIKQRDQLTQLLCIIRFTGNSQLEEYNLVIQDYQTCLRGLEAEIVANRDFLNRDASLIADLQLGVSALMTRIDGLDKKQIYIRSTEHLLNILPIFYEKLDELVQSLNELRSEFPYAWEEMGFKKRNMLNQAGPTTPSKYLRVGEDWLEIEGSDDDEFEDYKVPGRLEIKAQNAKFVEQGLLRLGIATRQKKKAADKDEPVNLDVVTV
ncbi:unnamed protein product [Orchesella dallaii]|uniref:Uncharacterized protein n=1 Tax=Orchesella dallaii TaxID=48710 RepID=A0ABP1RCH1_9HEXA